jgi:hypothetical protein
LRHSGERFPSPSGHPQRLTLLELALPAAGGTAFEIARMMGTSIEQIEKTYGHLLPNAIERGRAALEAFDARSSAAAHGL